MNRIKFAFSFIFLAAGLLFILLLGASVFLVSSKGAVDLVLVPSWQTLGTFFVGSVLLFVIWQELGNEVKNLFRSSMRLFRRG